MLFKKQQVIAVDESSFEIEYWKGSWKTKWKPWELAGGNVWTDTAKGVYSVG